MLQRLAYIPALFKKKKKSHRHDNYVAMSEDWTQDSGRKEKSYRPWEQAFWFLFDPDHIFLWPVNKMGWLWQDELLLSCPCIPIDLMLLSPEWLIVSTHTEHSTTVWRGSQRTGCLGFYEITFSISPELDPVSPSQKRELNLNSASLVE